MLNISGAQMQAIDRYAIEKIGIPSIVLMENAAIKVVETIDLEATESYTIICATGNNGGDGLAVARHLFLNNKIVDLFIIGEPDKGTNDFKINLNILKNINLPFTILNNDPMNEKDLLEKSLKENDLTIDALFGIGLNREVSGLYSQIIKKINQHARKVLAVDIPSGLDANCGKVLGLAVKADQTISFHQIKKGLTRNKLYSGEVLVADIGIPDFVTQIILDRFNDE